MAGDVSLWRCFFLNFINKQTFWKGNVSFSHIWLSLLLVTYFVFAPSLPTLNNTESPQGISAAGRTPQWLHTIPEDWHPHPPQWKGGTSENNSLQLLTAAAWSRVWTIFCFYSVFTQPPVSSTTCVQHHTTPHHSPSTCFQPVQLGGEQLTSQSTGSSVRFGWLNRTVLIWNINNNLSIFYWPVATVLYTLHTTEHLSVSDLIKQNGARYCSSSHLVNCCLLCLH